MWNIRGSRGHHDGPAMDREFMLEDGGTKEGRMCRSVVGVAQCK